MEKALLRDPAIWLASELAARRAKNSSYSLRSFARKLQIPPGRLSEFISGKRPISFEQGVKIAEILCLAPQERQKFLEATMSSKSAKGSVSEINSVYQTISMDAFHVIADWYHVAILSLMDTEDFRSEAAWIASRLNLPKTTVERALKRLVRTGLVDEVNGQYQKLESNLVTSEEIRSPALRSSHRQTLEQASSALDELELSARDITSISIAMDPEKLPAAKKMIKTFRRRFCKSMEAGKQTEVYNLNVQLIPVTMVRKNKGKGL